MAEPMEPTGMTDHTQEGPQTYERRSESHADTVQPVPSDGPPTARQDDGPEDFTHYVHLADGSVVKHKMTEPLGSHLPEGEDADLHGGRAIVGVYPR